MFADAKNRWQKLMEKGRIVGDSERRSRRDGKVVKKRRRGRRDPAFWKMMHEHTRMTAASGVIRDDARAEKCISQGLFNCATLYAR